MPAADLVGSMRIHPVSYRIEVPTDAAKEIFNATVNLLRSRQLYLPSTTQPRRHVLVFDWNHVKGMHLYNDGPTGKVDCLVDASSECEARAKVVQFLDAVLDDADIVV